MQQLPTQSLLALLHLSSPSLPIGAFAYSQGLETAVDLNWVTDETSLEAWLRPQLSHGLSQLEVPLLKRCYESWQIGDETALLHWQAIFWANRDSAELLHEEQQLGQTLRRLLTNLDCPLPECASKLSYLPLYAGALAHFQVPLESGVIGWIWSWLENQITVACKTVPLGQTAAQNLLRKLMPEVEHCATRGLALSDDAIGMTLPTLAMVSAWHETQYSRLFRS